MSCPYGEGSRSVAPVPAYCPTCNDKFDCLVTARAVAPGPPRACGRRVRAAAGADRSVRLSVTIGPVPVSGQRLALALHFKFLRSPGPGPMPFEKQAHGLPTVLGVRFFAT